MYLKKVCDDLQKKKNLKEKNKAKEMGEGGGLGESPPLFLRISTDKVLGGGGRGGGRREDVTWEKNEKPLIGEYTSIYNIFLSLFKVSGL